MPVNKPHLFNSGVYFITFTNYKWLQLIAITDAFDAVYKWFDYLKHEGHSVCGYVIMPNHIHVLIHFDKPAKSLNTIIGNGKRFLAYEIVQRLKEENNQEILAILAEGVKAKDRSRRKLHEVFQPSFDVKECLGVPFINQKLAYMHNNPLSGKWSLAVDTVSYTHSSAQFYETGVQGVYEVRNVMELVDKNWAIAP